MEHPRAHALAMHGISGDDEAQRILDGLTGWQRRQETARLVALLGRHPEGLGKSEILGIFYEDYARSSLLRRTSLEVRLNKLLQRARRRIRQQGADVAFDRVTRRWRLVISTPRA